ncbi:zinc finger CCHC domain-containing protein 9-like [Phlebotomus papatasi]|uniref:zinc finger CCHC domain-containing protein 9-like n=1 Tax=Phlebotomus papatasi TaxID=29031 RepID=UPI0024832F9D|nr:zinc finger CCHC domain-containing protein 9-like [Phlebotomus papatasi]
MFSKNKKKFKRNFSRKKVFKRHGKESGDAVLKMDDLSDGDNEKSERENENEKKVMKERERNYKKFLIEQGRSSATKWETFSEDEEEVLAESPDTSLPKKSKGKKKKFEKTEDVTSSRKKPKNKKTADDFGQKIKEALSENEEETIPQSLDQSSDKCRGIKRKLEKTGEDVTLPEKKSKNRKKSEDSGQKMEKVKAKLKAKYDNDKWEKIPRELPREKSQQRCLGCRELGHLLKDCKVFAKKARDICLKCGSSDHKHNVCPVYKGPRFDYATCFKCKQMGHISKYCPKNAHGIYPDGGSCNFCQGVDHLARDYPKNRRRGGRKRHTKDSKKFYRVNKPKN